MAMNLRKRERRKAHARRRVAVCFIVGGATVVEGCRFPASDRYPYSLIPAPPCSKAGRHQKWSVASE